MRLRPDLREHGIGTTGIAQPPAQFAQTTEEIDAGLDFEQETVGRFDGNLRREGGRDLRQPLHELLLAQDIARPRIDGGYGGERRTQRHADANPGRPRPRFGIDDALVVIFGIDDDERGGWRHALVRHPQCQHRQLRHMRGDPQLARLERERGLFSWSFWRALGRRRRRPHP